MNFVFITGRLTRAPEIRYTKDQKPVAKFTLAVERNYKDSSGERPVDFLDFTAFRGPATFIERYIHKGDKISVTGELQVSRWQTRDGENRSKIVIVCNTVEILAKPKSGQNRGDDYAPRAKKEYESRQQDDSQGSGYEVYSPPGLEDMDGEQPY